MLVSRRTVVGIVLGVLGGSVGLALLAVWALPFFLPGRVLPGVRLGGVPIGGKTAGEVRSLLASDETAATRRVRFAANGRDRVSLTAADIGATLDPEATASAALAAGRTPGWPGVLARAALLLAGREVPLAWSLHQPQLVARLEGELASEIRPPTEPTWSLTPEGSFIFLPGADGTALAPDELAPAVADRLRRGSAEPVNLRLVTVPPAPTDADARVAGAAASRVLSRPLTLTTEDTTVTLAPEDLASWVRPASPSAARAGAAPESELDRTAIVRTLATAVAPKVARPAQDATFVRSGNRATAFAPPTKGAALALEESATAIFHGLAAGADNIRLVTRAVPPTVLVTPEMAQLGVRALLARGETDFAGSPRNRIHNIRAGAEKYHGLLVPPGGEFSFNANLGPVDAAAGFLPELVILSNVTTPQYGGGLCQVSTTMFRSAVRAGLPITARKNHAYAVSYYGTPGFDATIYPPNPDLRFVNDTPGHLLIQTRLEGTKLAFELWGTPDGREVELLGPTPYGRRPDGAVKATLVRKVTKGGQTLRDEWFSNYKSPKLFPKVLAANAETETWEQRVARIAEKDRRIQEEFDRRKAELARRAEKPTVRTRPSPSPAPEG